MTTRSSIGTTLVVVVAVGGFVLSAGNGLWSLANPRGDIDAVKKSLQEYQTQTKADINELRNRIEWRYVQKEVLDLDIKRLDRDLNKAEVETQRRDEILRNRIDVLSQSVNLTYSAKDALKALQDRIGELEKALRDTAKQPVPVTQK